MRGVALAATLLFAQHSHATSGDPDVSWGSWAPNAQASYGDEVQGLQAMGRQGTQADLSELMSYLTRPWPFNATAAFAIGELARRDAADTSEARQAIIGLLTAFDPRTREAAADALRRMGLDSANAAQIKHVANLTLRVSAPRARACLLEAVGPHLDQDTGGELWIEGVSSTAREVRAATLRHLSHTIQTELLTLYLLDADPWVRLETVRALANRDDADVSEALADYVSRGVDPWAGLEAGRASSTLSDAASEDPLLRLAAVEHNDEPARLREVALGDPDTRVRVAAADKLAQTNPSLSDMRALLRSADPVVTAIGATGLKGASLVSSDADELGACVKRATLSNEDLLIACLDALAEVPPKAKHPRYEQAVQALREQSKTSKRLASRLNVVVEKSPIQPPPATSTPVVSVITSKGSFRMQLEPARAPQTVASFAALAREGFYDDLPVHRVVPGFVAQTGCPRGDGWGGPGYSVADEFSEAPFSVGAVGLARSEHDSGGSQWFVMTGSHPHLVGRYTRFGEVISGMEVVRQLTAGDRIERVTVERPAP